MATHSHIKIFIIILAVVMIVQSKLDSVSYASFVAYQKLENALVTDKKLLYLLQEALFPSQGLNRGDCRHSCWLGLYMCVTVGGVQPGNCNCSTLSGNFTYCQSFRWSSSALFDLILNDQLFVIDNVVSEVIFHLMERRDFINVALQVDALPCGTTEDDLLAALMRLLPWVRTYFIMVYMHFTLYYIVMHFLFINYAAEKLCETQWHTKRNRQGIRFH